MITRRTFAAAATLVAALLAAPGFAWAQDTQKRRVAFTILGMPLEDLAVWEGTIAFREGLREHGYVEGRNVVIDLWSGAGRTDVDEYARDIVASEPEVIVAVSGCSVGRAAMRHTKTIPIVFNSGSPIRCGLVSNLANPGGNVTGFMNVPGLEFEGKRLQLLLEAVPSATRFGFLIPRHRWALLGPVMTDAAVTLGITLVPYILEPPVDEQAYRRAFAAMANDGIDAVLGGVASENNAHRKLIAQLALDARLPATQFSPDFAQVGGLISYAAPIAARFRGMAGYVARILNGENPGDLPVQQPTKFDLVVNLETAKAIGVTLPNDFLLRANEVIE